MRAAISTIVVLGGALGATAIGSLSEFIVDIPSCSYSSFSKAVEKEGCDVKNVNADTLKCLCKHLTSIVVTMNTDDLDLNCQASKLTTSASTFVEEFAETHRMPRCTNTSALLQTFNPPLQALALNGRSKVLLRLTCQSPQRLSLPNSLVKHLDQPPRVRSLQVARMRRRPKALRRRRRHRKGQRQQPLLSLASSEALPLSPVS